MGVVYHAIDPNIGRPVAIKTIRFGDTRKPEELDRMRERLFREARSAGILSHPGIVTIYDVDQQGDIAYIAMEYVDGPTLDQVLSEVKPIASDRMFSILAQTASALDYAHSKGIVHRDIKPANIMLAADGTTKITDFGIAKINTAEHLTMTGSIVGTPHYMSPEQVQGQHVDGRSDQFSLAVIAYEMLTGEKPYTGEHLTTVVYKIVAEDPVPAHRINPGLAGGIEGALRKAMAKKPDARYKTCQDFIETLEKAGAATKGWKPLARGGLLHEPTMADAPAPEAAVPTKVLAPPRRPRRADATGTGAGPTATAAKRKTGFFSFLLAALVAGGLLALIGWQAAPYVMTWLQPPANEHQAAVPKEQGPPPTAQPETAPPASTPPARTAATSTAAPSPEDAKPSPTGPLTEEARPVEPVRPPAGAPVNVAHTGPAQDVTFTTSPGGARVSLDGNTSEACSTPCTLKAASGKHTLMAVLPGYEIERREFQMGSSPLELAPLVLRAAGGTLMLTSEPKGATVLINGKRIEMVTPAQIPLAPGTYQITVEKDGRQSTSQVEIRNGINYSKIPLDR
uniref:non-specific serine/threonine protein kinase n=1 Tax=Solibacter usitatus (strain Ellin6076) TaxID=234267 RepID=Q01U30_SOLUE